MGLWILGLIPISILYGVFVYPFEFTFSLIQGYVIQPLTDFFSNISL